MKFTLKSLVLLLSLASIVSCSKKDEQITPVKEEVTPTVEAPIAKETKELIYIYKGETFKINLSVTADSVTLLDGPDNDKVQEILEVAQVQHLNPLFPYTILVFETETERANFIARRDNISNTDESQLQRSNSYCQPYAELRLHADLNQTGWFVSANRSCPDIQVFEASMGRVVNDQATSISWKGCDVKLFVNFNYSGAGLYLEGSWADYNTGYNTIGDLRIYKYGFWNNYNFNDKISSFYIKEPYSSPYSWKICY